MTKKSKSNKNSNKEINSKYRRIEMYLVLGVAVAIVGLLMVFASLTNNSAPDLTGKAFSYSGCTELPCFFNNVAVDHYQGFEFKNTLYKFKIKDLDETNKRMKYEITTMEVDETEEEADLIIQSVDEDIDDNYLYLDITIKNVGGENIYDTFKVFIKTLDEDDDEWKSTYQYVEGLDADEDYILEIGIKYDTNYYNEFGKIPYHIYVDSTDTIDESDETNNDEDDHYS
jgi:hypothetical protein